MTYLKTVTLKISLDMFFTHIKPKTHTQINLLKRLCSIKFIA